MRPWFLLFPALLLGGCLSLPGVSPEKRVMEGDVVVVDYTIHFEGGEVFATSRRELAEDVQIPKSPYFRESADYLPLIFRVGEGEGLEEEVEATVIERERSPLLRRLGEDLKGLAIGEEKTVEIPMEEGFGPRDPDRVRRYSRVLLVPLIEEFSPEEFFNLTRKLPLAGRTYDLRAFPWTVTVLNLTQEAVTVRHNVEEGTQVQMEGVSWNSTFVRLPEGGMGLRAEVEPGEAVFLSSGIGYVTEVDEESFTVDFNPPQAGHALTFRLRLLDIVRKGEEEERALAHTEDDPFLGSPDASVKIVAFMDFECPFSKRSLLTLYQVQREHGDRVQIFIRDFPNPAFPNAEPAAEAAGCALEQDRFWEYQFKLYDSQKNLTRETLHRLAGEIGLDPGAFQACLAAGKRRGEVTQDLLDGRKLEVSATPTFFINGRRIVGATQVSEWEGSEFQAMIEEALSR
jgi:FKBP-type peptidyl-prolyl cis-trans isomerase 2